MDDWNDMLGDLNDTTPVQITERDVGTDIGVDTVASHKPLCDACGAELTIQERSLICEKCGFEIVDASGFTEETYSTSDVSGGNVNDKGFMSMRLVGRTAYSQNQSLLKSSANYIKYSNNTIMKELKQINSQSATSDAIPSDVIEKTANTYTLIKAQGYVFRKDVKRGVLSACAHDALIARGISRTPAEVAAHFQVAEKYHSQGDRFLRDMHERGIIEINTMVNHTSDYVKRYTTVLGIPARYIGFIEDLIQATVDARLHVLSDSKNNTKCIGAIYMLVDRMPGLGVSKLDIETKCDISKTTYMKFYNLINKYYRKFVHVFVRHRIPMKAAWKDL